MIRLAIPSALILIGIVLLIVSSSIRRVVLDPAASGSALSARRVRELIKEGFGAQSEPIPYDKAMTHYVFLVNTSQAKQTPYVNYVRFFIARFTNDLRQEAKGWAVMPDDQSLLSLYPYQNGLYTGEYASERLPLASGVEDRLLKPIPDQNAKPIPTNPDGSAYDNGHREIESRNQLMARIPNPAGDAQGDDKKRAVVIVQISPFKVDDPPKGQTSVPPSEADLPPGWAAYGKIETDTGDEGNPNGPIALTLSVYGPSGAGAIEGFIADSSRSMPVLEPSEVPWSDGKLGSLGVVAIAVGALFVCLLSFGRGYRVSIGPLEEGKEPVSRYIGRRGRLDVYAHGAGQIGDHVLLVPQRDSGTVSAEKIGEVRFGLFDPEPSVRGVSPYSSVNSVGRDGPIRLVSNGSQNLVLFRSSVKETDRMSFNVREGKS